MCDSKYTDMGKKPTKLKKSAAAQRAIAVILEGGATEVAPPKVTQTTLLLVGKVDSSTIFDLLASVGLVAKVVHRLGNIAQTSPVAAYASAPEAIEYAGHGAALSEEQLVGAQTAGPLVVAVDGTPVSDEFRMVLLLNATFVVVVDNKAPDCAKLQFGPFTPRYWLNPGTKAVTPLFHAPSLEQAVARSAAAEPFYRSGCNPLELEAMKALMTKLGESDTETLVREIRWVLGGLALVCNAKQQAINCGAVILAIRGGQDAVEPLDTQRVYDEELHKAGGNAKSATVAMNRRIRAQLRLALKMCSRSPRADADHLIMVVVQFQLPLWRRRSTELPTEDLKGAEALVRAARTARDQNADGDLAKVLYANGGVAFNPSNANAITNGPDVFQIVYGGGGDAFSPIYGADGLVLPIPSDIPPICVNYTTAIPPAETALLVGMRRALAEKLGKPADSTEVAIAVIHMLLEKTADMMPNVNAGTLQLVEADGTPANVERVASLVCRLIFAAAETGSANGRPALERLVTITSDPVPFPGKDKDVTYSVLARMYRQGLMPVEMRGALARLVCAIIQGHVDGYKAEVAKAAREEARTVRDARAAKVEANCLREPETCILPTATYEEMLASIPETEVKTGDGRVVETKPRYVINEEFVVLKTTKGSKGRKGKRSGIRHGKPCRLVHVCAGHGWFPVNPDYLGGSWVKIPGGRKKGTLTPVVEGDKTKCRLSIKVGGRVKRLIELGAAVADPEALEAAEDPEATRVGEAAEDAEDAEATEECEASVFEDDDDLEQPVTPGIAAVLAALAAPTKEERWALLRKAVNDLAGFDLWELFDAAGVTHLAGKLFKLFNLHSICEESPVRSIEELFVETAAYEECPLMQCGGYARAEQMVQVCAAGHVACAMCLAGYLKLAPLGHLTCTSSVWRCPLCRGKLLPDVFKRFGVESEEDAAALVQDYSFRCRGCVSEGENRKCGKVVAMPKPEGDCAAAFAGEAAALEGEAAAAPAIPPPPTDLQCTDCFERDDARLKDQYEATLLELHEEMIEAKTVLRISPCCGEPVTLLDGCMRITCQRPHSHKDNGPVNWCFHCACEFESAASVYTHLKDTIGDYWKKVFEAGPELVRKYEVLPRDFEGAQ